MTVTKLTETEYAVTSETVPGVKYTVDAVSGRCTCPAGRRGAACKHAQATLAFIQDQKEPVVTNGTPAGGKPPKLLKLGYEFGVVTSAMQKEIRRGDEMAAVYWMQLLAASSAQYAWKRVLITAAEDIGLASPETVYQVGNLYEQWQAAKLGAYYVSNHHLTMAVMLLCRAPKSTEVEDLQSLVLAQIKMGQKRPILREYVDGHTAQGKAEKRTWAEWYSDRHTRFGIPVNKYTEMFWDLMPDQRPEEFPKPTEVDNL